MGRFTAFLCGALVLVVVGVAMGGESSTHSVTIKVQKLNEMVVTRGNIPVYTTLSEKKSSAMENSPNCALKWMTDRSGKKITVTINRASTNCKLRVQAENCMGGISANRVTLTVSDQDFITGMSMRRGMCDLKYTANARVSVRTGTEIHTVTYTITDVF